MFATVRAVKLLQTAAVPKKEVSSMNRLSQTYYSILLDPGTKVRSAWIDP